MKILVSLKRVADPDNADKVRVRADGAAVDSSGMEGKVNPFDEYALEAALRLTEDARAPKVRLGEVVVVTIGPPEADAVPLRSALATGAARALRIDARDEALDGELVARVLERVVREEQPDLVLLGKQAVDGDTNQVGQLLAERLDWPLAAGAATLFEEDGALRVGREVDGGVLNVRVRLPAVVTVDLRVVASRSVRSRVTPTEHVYPEGVRFAPLPAVMAAKKKPLTVRPLSELLEQASCLTRYVAYEPALRRAAGVRVTSARELVERLVREAKVL